MKSKNYNLIIFSVVIVFGFLGFGKNVLAAQYYVSPKGNTPWPLCLAPNSPCDLQVAATNAIHGDTIYLRGGTYVLPRKTGTNWEAGLQPTNSGTEAEPITFKAYPGEIPFLDNSKNNVDPPVGSFGVNSQNYIVFDGLHTIISVADGLGHGGLLHQTTGSVIKNCDIEGVSDGGGNISSIRNEKTSYCTITNNKLYGSHGGAPNGSGILAYETANTQVYGNDIYNNSTGIYDKGGGENNNYFRNFIYSNEASGVRIGTEAGANPHDISVYQNIFLSNGGNSIEQFPAKKDVTRINSYNNTIYNSGDVAIYYNNVGTVSKTDYTSYNNIIVASSGILNYTSGVVSFSDYNNYPATGMYTYNGSGLASLASFQGATTFDDHSRTTSPGFVNPGGATAEDYKRSSYPTDGRGGAYASVMGAYITGEEIIGYSGESDVLAPNAPANLSVL